MYLQRLEIEGFRGFGAPFEIEFSEGLNVLVGENGRGKSAVIDAIRLILHSDDYGRTGLRPPDFHRPFGEDAKTSEWLRIQAKFGGLTSDEQVAFLPWTNADDTALLTLRAEDKETTRNRFRRKLWGGASSASFFEWELMDMLDCVYLPPLRDAEARLREGRGSRLARLITKLTRPELDEAKKAEQPHRLVEKVQTFQAEVATDSTLPPHAANELIRGALQEAVGELFSQGTSVQFSEATFDRIVESLRLLFHPETDEAIPPELFRSLEENSLGANNLLYLATVLAELSEQSSEPTEDPRFLRLLLIEEPEAHVHPQVQVRLLRSLEERAKTAGFQVIVTTHSPVLASSASLGSIIHMSRDDDSTFTAVRLSQCGLPDASNAFISRWLDVTKSTLLFARGVILVEGIAEALLLPELARRVLREQNARRPEDTKKLPASLADAGVSVINMNGVYFTHFLRLFASLDSGTHQHLPVRCAGVTDRDPDEEKPTRACPGTANNRALRFVDRVKDSPNCRLYHGLLKTFEYDLAMEGGNLAVMLAALCDARAAPTPGAHCPCLNRWDEEDDDAKRDEALDLLGRIEGIGKGYYAQRLADALEQASDCKFAVPSYIRDAVLWAVGVDGD